VEKLTEVEEAIAMLKAKTGQDLKLNVVQNMEESFAHFFFFWNMSQGFQIQTEIRIFAIVSVRLCI